jgi:peptidoglycan/xylan/chitin deacetylase (PgdA/CDA1 family)
VTAAAHPLELLLRPLRATALDDDPTPAAPEGPRVVCRRGVAGASWLRAGDWRIYASSSSVGETAGDAIQSFAREDGSETHAVVGPEGAVIVPFSFADAYRGYVSESWRETANPRRLSERTLRVYYTVKRLVPRRAQLAARRALIRRQSGQAFPSWPLDTSVARLLRFYAGCALRAANETTGQFAWFWPGGFDAAVVLTHDVESDEGIRLALELADVEEELGFRSSFNFGAWYAHLDPGVLRELDSRGFEIGMHGLRHDRRLFSSRAAFEEQLAPLSDLAARLGARGFRSPATHRVFDWLGELPVDYDATIPNSDPYEPQPGGCCSVWPFFVGNVVELPYTLPQDHTLLTLLGHRSPALWLEQAVAIEHEHGLIQCVSHPDRGYLGDADKRAVYRELLRGLSEREGLWRALPREVAGWWRKRADADPAELPLGTMRIDGSTVVFEQSR